MSAPRVLVTGATGKVGSALTAQLLSRGTVRVRALVHRRDARAEQLARLGAEVVLGDLFDAAQVEAALEGVQRVAYIPPWHPHVLSSAMLLASAAPKAGVEAIVGLTQWLASPEHPALSTRQMWLVDRLFDALPGVAHVTVNPGFFADNSLLVVPMASLLGVFPWPTGGGRNAPPSNEDIARVMTGALLDPARHAGRTYRPTGPRMMSGDDLAQALAQAVGKRVRHVDLPVSMMMRAVRVQGRRLGVEGFLQSQFRWFLEETRLGTWEAGGVTDAVRTVGEAEPEDFEVIARRYLARDRLARATLTNRLRLLLDGLRVAVTAALDVPRFEQLQQHPAPAAWRFSGQSARWAAEHGVALALPFTPAEPAARVRTTPR